MNLQAGIPVETYLVSIPDESLARLRARIGGRIHSRAPLFAGWLADAIDDESARRCRSLVGVPREPSMPTLPLSWPNREVAGALLAAHTLVQTADDPALVLFSTRLLTVVTALASCRLERPT